MGKNLAFDQQSEHIIANVFNIDQVLGPGLQLFELRRKYKF
jgi:hypothetical protein